MRQMTKLTKQQLAEIDKIDGMKSNVKICGKQTSDLGEATLKVIDTKILIERFDEDTMEVYVIYKGCKYYVQGNCYFSYIVIE